MDIVDLGLMVRLLPRRAVLKCKAAKDEMVQVYEVQEWSLAGPFKWTRENALWCKPLDILALEDGLLVLKSREKLQ